jgi:hypothetical protein
LPSPALIQTEIDALREWFAAIKQRQDEIEGV